MCIAGNKCDLEDQQITEGELKEFAEHSGCGYVITSAWQNQGIEVLYKVTCRMHSGRSLSSLIKKQDLRMRFQLKGVEKEEIKQELVHA